MGFKRWLWRNTGVGLIYDTVENMCEEKNILEGAKKTAKEYFSEDDPITSTLFKAGKKEGMLEGKMIGYEEAAQMFSVKYDELLYLFHNDIEKFEQEREEYKQLMDLCEQEISDLQEKLDRTEEENSYLNQLVWRYEELKKLA